MLMHATVSRCVHFSGVVLYLWSQYVNFTFSSQTAANICTHNIYKLFNIFSQSVSQGDGHTVGHPQSQRWLAQRQARPRPASSSSSSSGPGQAGQLEHDRYCAAATVIHSTMNLPPLFIHTYASDDDRSASSINANAHLMHIFRSLSQCFFCVPFSTRFLASRFVTYVPQFQSPDPNPDSDPVVVAVTVPDLVLSLGLCCDVMSQGDITWLQLLNKGIT